ncbi:TOMM precursor leader peptide-binding protein [Labedaea rhizosphaerae]|uniref:Ribosomal protein S12 methylthiotransferase accessory factor n=1 Tax=Labedaea rhizosphaerae TaxID=598644 RepID=A0A4R6S9C3_LABRH|nr:TOMM precursor leader peptide-binding protein [Labedaea rhizosphaerae]TDP96599.1 ribosomal protein S12 methylthiotransferase accessory factor [Labedaea rhizosphaerae]
MHTPGSPAAGLVGFKRNLRAEVVAGEATYLFSERGVTALRSAELEALTPLLDGTRDLPTLLDEAPDSLAPERIGSLMQHLAKAGLVTVRPPTAPGTDQADEKVLTYWESAGLDPQEAAARTASGEVALITLGGIDGAQALTTLRAGGLTVANKGPDDGTALTVVLCPDYLSPRLGEIDSVHRAAGRPWLLARPSGTQLWIGPVFTPDGACWHCLAHRLWSHRQAEAHVQATLGRTGPAERTMAELPASTTMALGLVALEASKWLAGYRYPGQSCVWTLDGFDLTGTRHELRRRPQCSACGDPGLVAAAVRRPVRLGSRQKACYSGGGHRAAAPDKTMAAYQHLISPITGVVTGIHRDTRGPAFFNSFLAGSNPSTGGGLDGLRAALRACNGGKGVTAEHAEVSALCEALERHSGTWHGDEYQVRGSYASLGDAALHPGACLLYDDRQYADRVRWNASHSALQYVCDPFDEQVEMGWTPIWSLTEGRQRLLPTAMLYFGAPGIGVRADSNGNAAGSSLEDAVLQGVLELIERDAVALWWYNRTPQPGIDLDAFADPWIEELREVHAGLGRAVWAIDLTADLGVPVIAALSRRVDAGTDTQEIMLGFGAHLDPKVALRRALTELNQMMPSVLAENRYGCGDGEIIDWWRGATTENQPYLMPAVDVPAKGPADFEYQPRTDLREDIEFLHNRLRADGMQLLVLDQTRPDIGLPVVKVVVPGLRGFWARYAPGRLFDVPVRLGRLVEPTPYEELNPIPMFL